MSKKVIPLNPNPEDRPVLTCPACGLGVWILVVDKMGEDWDHITSLVCADCGFEEDWDNLFTVSTVS